MMFECSVAFYYLLQRAGDVLVVTNEVSSAVPIATSASQDGSDCVYTGLFSPLTRMMRAVEVYGSQTTVS